MCSQNKKLLNMECNGEIINILVTGEYTRANTDLVFAQEVFDKHTKRYTVTNRLSDTNELLQNMESFATSMNNDTENIEENVEVAEENSNSMDSLWSEAETLLFISLYDNHKDDFTHAKKRKHVWALIAEQMAAHNYFWEVDNLERKWTNLMRVYRAIKDNKGPRKTGRGAQNYKYFEKLEETVGDKPSNKLSTVFSCVRGWS